MLMVQVLFCYTTDDLSKQENNYPAVTVIYNKSCVILTTRPHICN